MPIVSEKYLKSRFSKLELSIFLEQKRLYSKIILPVRVTTKLPEEISDEYIIEGRDRNIPRVLRLINQRLNPAIEKVVTKKKKLPKSKNPKNNIIKKK